MKININVVALSHCDVRDYWKEYTAEAVGKQLTFVPEPENVKDPYAVRAREGSLHIGYVPVSDLDMFYQALKGSGKKRLRGTVVESFPEPALLIVLGQNRVDAGLNAGQLVRTLGKEIQGGGGGQPHFATAGGKNPDGIDKALAVAKEMLA